MSANKTSSVARVLRRVSIAVGFLASGIVLAGVLPVSCDQNAQTVFRHTATVPIGDGVKTALAGDPKAGLDTAVAGIIDGIIASIDQAGR